MEELSGEKRLINVAYLVMVALDGDERPTPVPPLVPRPPEEQREGEAGRERTRLRKQRRAQ